MKKNKEEIMRSKIMRKAFTLMSKKGIDAVSMREIAASLKVTKPVLYYYFKNKEDLCTSIIRAAMSALHSEMKINQYNSVLDFLKDLFKSHVDFFSKDPRNMAFMVHVMSYHLKQGTDACERDRERAEKVEAFAKFLKKYEQKGDIPKGSEKDFMHLTAAVLAHLTVDASFDKNIKLDQHLHERLAHIILLGIKEYYK